MACDAALKLFHGAASGLGAAGVRLQGRDPSTAHAGSLCSPARFAQDDKGLRGTVPPLETPGYLSIVPFDFAQGRLSGTWFPSFLTYPGLTSGAKLCRRFAARQDYATKVRVG